MDDLNEINRRVEQLEAGLAEVKAFLKRSATQQAGAAAPPPIAAPPPAVRPRQTGEFEANLIGSWFARI